MIVEISKKVSLSRIVIRRAKTKRYLTIPFLVILELTALMYVFCKSWSSATALQSISPSLSSISYIGTRLADGCSAVAFL